MARLELENNRPYGRHTGRAGEAGSPGIDRTVTRIEVWIVTNNQGMTKS